GTGQILDAQENRSSSCCISALLDHGALHRDAVARRRAFTWILDSLFQVRLEPFGRRAAKLYLAGQPRPLCLVLGQLVRSLMAAPWACRLTIHSSRSRFAARLNSGVRPQVRRNTGQK